MFFRLLILLLGAAVGYAEAQTPMVVPNMSDAFWAVTVNASPANEATIQQAGQGNQALLTVMAGSQNWLSISQAANNNEATIRVTGQANGLLLTQMGGTNTVSMGLSGNDNQLKISQDGGDTATLSGLTGNSTRLELIQRSGNNTFVADGPIISGNSTGFGVANLRIEQRGGATAHIQTSRLPGQ